jgi:hypothetical protein
VKVFFAADQFTEIGDAERNATPITIVPSKIIFRIGGSPLEVDVIFWHQTPV